MESKKGGSGSRARSWDSKKSGSSDSKNADQMLIWIRNPAFWFLTGSAFGKKRIAPSKCVARLPFAANWRRLDKHFWTFLCIRISFTQKCFLKIFLMCIWYWYKVNLPPDIFTEATDGHSLWPTYCPPVGIAHLWPIGGQGYCIR